MLHVLDLKTYFLLYLDLLNSYTRDDEVGIRLCYMVPRHLCSCWSSGFVWLCWTCKGSLSMEKGDV